jgi:aromatic ring hydroxylase
MPETTMKNIEMSPMMESRNLIIKISASLMVPTPSGLQKNGDDGSQAAIAVFVKTKNKTKANKARMFFRSAILFL